MPLKSKLSPSVSKPQNDTGQRREALRKRQEGLPVVDVTAHTVHIAMIFSYGLVHVSRSTKE